MKKIFPVFIVIMITILASCKKDKKSSDSGDTSSPKTVISKDSSDDGTNTNNRQVRLFTYNSSKKLIKVSYKNGTSTTYTDYDSITYSGEYISSVKSYTVGNPTPYATTTYTFTSENLTSTHEIGSNSNGAFVRDRTFTYTSGVLSAITVVYTSGSNDGSPENISSIVFTSGNISSAYLSDIPAAATLTADLTAPNPYYGLDFKTDDPLNIFNKNNVLKAYPTGFPSNPLLDYSYTYANNRVATITDNTKSPVLVTYITYKNI